ncbi:MAG TPA: MBL fold metallo-hydrolase [Candidatus Udaeobacter sp.]
MSLVFKTIQTEGIAELSYLVGDDDEGVAAVFDPRADCDVYIEAARDAGVIITHIFETHIHADLVSGSRELCARLESAKIYASGEGGAEYGFNPEKIKDGDRFEFGEVIVTARHTPGHTPEHMSYLLSEARRESLSSDSGRRLRPPGDRSGGGSARHRRPRRGPRARGAAALGV